MLRVAVCDDEKMFSDHFTGRIDDYFRERKIAHAIHVFSSGEDLLREAEAILPDVVFLDISMKGKNGIETAKLLREKNRDICIILVTGHMNYVLEGYKVQALRYLVKEQFDASFEECMEAVLKQFHLHMGQLCFPFAGGDAYLTPDEISLVESRGHRLLFYGIQGRLLGQMQQKLDNMETVLCVYEFLRVHKSYLVNMKYITGINHYRLYLTNGTELPVPKTRYPAVRMEYALYKGENG